MRRGTITAWMRVHTWSSLICTAFLLMLCVTGLPLIFHDEIDAWTNPQAPLPAVALGTRPLGLDALLARALAGRPGEVPLYMSFDEDRPVVNVTTGPAPDAPAVAMTFRSLDARTGEVLPPAQAGIMDTVLQLHIDMMLGLPGELFLGVMGLLFTLALISGVVLYAPFTARLRFGTVRAQKSPRVRRLDRHNLLGMTTLAWALVVGLTGSVNAFVTPITDIWKADQLASLAAPGTSVPATLSSLEAAMAKATRAAPGKRVQFVAFPGVTFSTNRHYAIFTQGTTPLTKRLLVPAFVDASTGRLDAVRPMPWYMQTLLLAQPFHFGDYAGLPMKLLWAALDILTIWVLTGGLRLWLTRSTRPLRTPAFALAGE